jgi:hypothetical protein
MFAMKLNCPVYLWTWYVELLAAVMCIRDVPISLLFLVCLARFAGKQFFCIIIIIIIIVIIIKGKVFPLQARCGPESG